MKKLFILFAFITFSSIAQTKVSTSLDDYNYLTKGYVIEQQSGLSPKLGYKLTQPIKIDLDLYSFEFKYFSRQSDGKVLATQVIAKSKGWGNVYYLCIPVNNQDLDFLYYNQLDSWDKPMLVKYSYALSSFSSSIFDSVFNK